METPYSKAWLEFATGEGMRAIRDNSILSSPLQLPYLENRIKQAFAAGWNARGYADAERAADNAIPVQSEER